MQKLSTTTLIPMGLSATAIALAFTLGVWKGQLDRRIDSIEAESKQVTHILSQIMILRQDIEAIKNGPKK